MNMFVTDIGYTSRLLSLYFELLYLTLILSWSAEQLIWSLLWEYWEEDRNTPWMECQSHIKHHAYTYSCLWIMLRQSIYMHVLKRVKPTCLDSDISWIYCWRNKSSNIKHFLNQLWTGYYPDSESMAVLLWDAAVVLLTEVKIWSMSRIIH